jgi:hypothetical protein
MIAAIIVAVPIGVAVVALRITLGLAQLAAAFAQLAAIFAAAVGVPQLPAAFAQLLADFGVVAAIASALSLGRSRQRQSAGERGGNEKDTHTHSPVLPVRYCGPRPNEWIGSHVA